MGASLLKNVQYATFISEQKENETGILRNPMYAKGSLSQEMAYGCETVLESFEINLKKKDINAIFWDIEKK